MEKNNFKKRKERKKKEKGKKKKSTADSDFALSISSIYSRFSCNNRKVILVTNEYRYVW